MTNIILIGFMGCGKTTVGRRLSYRVRKTMIDTDKEIEIREKRSVTQIFDADGEEYFRRLETEVLKILLRDREKHVISVGGGLPMQKVNQVLLKKLGMVVFLKTSPETIAERLKNDKTRPLLQGGNPEDKIRKLLLQRTLVYEQLADVIVETDGKEFKQIIQEIQEAYHETFSHKRSQSKLLRNKRKRRLRNRKL